jgi:hypothetical protein
VLPFVPVVFEGIDDVGKELICGVQEWVKWIGKTSGRGEIGRLSETGGVEVEKSGGGECDFLASVVHASARETGWFGFSAVKGQQTHVDERGAKGNCF